MRYKGAARLLAFCRIEESLERGEIPGAAAVVGWGGREASFCAGDAVKTEELMIPASVETIYDCASLTKVVVTLPLVLRLIDRGEVGLDDPVSRYLGDFAAEGKADVTVRHLLTHTSGLPAHVKLYGHGWTREQIVAEVMRQPKGYATGTQMVYSDLGFIALGELAAAVYGCPLDEAARRYVFEPLGMAESLFCPGEELRPRIAATEFVPEEGAYRWGAVHDENAYAMGGVSGHAGLFSTASDLAKYARMWLNGGDGLLSERIVSCAVRSHTQGLPEANRGLGWVLKGDRWDASGERMSARSYGHTGFTGTSLWIDPELGLYAVLLTNRVHFGREQSVARLRREFHDAAAAAVSQERE